MGYPDWTAPIVFVLQEGELWPITEWVARQGQEKLWYIEVAVAASATETVNVYEVPDTKKLYLIRFWGSQEQITDYVFQYITPTKVLFKGRVGQYGPLLLAFAPPTILTAGKWIQLSFTNRGASGMTAKATLTAFELTV